MNENNSNGVHKPLESKVLKGVPTNPGGVVPWIKRMFLGGKLKFPSGSVIKFGKSDRL